MFDPQKNYPKFVESKAIIRFQDCDPLGHLNNSRYFDYFFNSREDQVPQVYEINPVSFFQKYDTNWVVYNHQIAYLRSAMPGEWIHVYSSAIYYDMDTKVTEYYMTDENKKVLKAVLWTISKYVDGKTGKRTNHQQEVLDFLKAIVVPDFDYHHHYFNDRIKEIKNSLV